LSLNRMFSAAWRYVKCPVSGVLALPRKASLTGREPSRSGPPRRVPSSWSANFDFSEISSRPSPPIGVVLVNVRGGRFVGQQTSIFPIPCSVVSLASRSGALRSMPVSAVAILPCGGRVSRSRIGPLIDALSSTGGVDCCVPMFGTGGACLATEGKSHWPPAFRLWPTTALLVPSSGTPRWMPAAKQRHPSLYWTFSEWSIINQGSQSPGSAATSSPTM
jgi:hypothetical protein